jgi:hypothetical protein
VVGDRKGGIPRFETINLFPARLLFEQTVSHGYDPAQRDSVDDMFVLPHRFKFSCELTARKMIRSWSLAI